MSYSGPVFPYYGSGQDLVTAALAASVNTLPKGAKQVLLTVTGANPVYFRITSPTDTSVATAADCVVNAVNRLLVSKDPDFTRISYVSPAGAGALNVIGCDGSSSI
jgi:hypothetical protein